MLRAVSSSHGARAKDGNEPRWITFSIDGTLAYPSTGEVIDTKTKAIVTALKDETGAAVQSENLREVDFKDGRPLRTGNQFGIGGRRAP